MFKFTSKLVILSVLLASPLTWAFPLPQEDEDGNEAPNNEEEEEEAEEEEAEEEYYEEETKGSTNKPKVQSKGDEKADNFFKRNFNIKKIASENFGITNFTRQSLYEQSANALYTYINDRAKDKIPTNAPTTTPSEIKPSSVDFPTKKYKVRERSSTLRNPFTNIHLGENEEGIKKTFEITVPNDVANNAGSTIEISIPTHWTSDSQLDINNPNNLQITSKVTQEGQDEGVQSFEAAIQQALLMSYKRTGINISSAILKEPEILETSTLQIPHEAENESNSTLKLVESLDSSIHFIDLLSTESTPKSEPEVQSNATPEVIVVNLKTTPEPEEVEYIEYIEEQLIERTRKPIRVRTTIPTTPKASVNPLKLLLAKQPSQTPGVSGFFLDSVINTTKSGARIAASAVWCALFDHCPGDKDEKK